MRLSELRRRDFSKYSNRKNVMYRKAGIVVEYDPFNDRWIYSSPDIILSGVYHGTLTELKKHLADEVNKVIGVKR